MHFLHNRSLSSALGIEKPQNNMYMYSYRRILQICVRHEVRHHKHTCVQCNRLHKIAFWPYHLCLVSVRVCVITSHVYAMVHYHNYHRSNIFLWLFSMSCVHKIINNSHICNLMTTIFGQINRLVSPKKHLTLTQDHSLHFAHDL
jgi:hypothetical protein